MRSFAVLVVFVSGCSPIVSADRAGYVYGPHQLAAVAETDQVPESSGVIASRTSPDVFWTHNDSGPYRARVWAFRLSDADRRAGVATHLGYVELAGATLTDWEDIAAGPGRTLYILDGGDNPPCDRADKQILRFREPTVDPDGGPVALTASFDHIHFEYPDESDPSLPARNNEERYDAECLLVHPTRGDIYVVTKRNNRNVPTARVYKLPADSITWNGTATHVLRFVADLSGQVPSMVTGGDIHADGRRIVVRNYMTAYEFTLPADEPFDVIFRQAPRPISLLIEPQGEAICYAGDGSLITTCEVKRFGSERFMVFVTPISFTPATAPDGG